MGGGGVGRGIDGFYENGKLTENKGKLKLNF